MSLDIAKCLLEGKIVPQVKNYCSGTFKEDVEGVWELGYQDSFIRPFTDASLTYLLMYRMEVNKLFKKCPTEKTHYTFVFYFRPT